MPKPSSRVVLNRSKLSELRLAIADGVLEIARTIVDEANPPDETPYGQGLVDRGGWAVWVDGKKVAGGSLDGTQPKKPRALKLDADQVVGIAGFGFPAQLQETGSVHQPARPFLWPAAVRVKAIAADIMRDIVGGRLRGTR